MDQIIPMIFTERLEDLRDGETQTHAHHTGDYKGEGE